MKNLSVRLARIYFWTEKALLGALLAFFLTALVLQLLGNILPDAVMMKLGAYALYLTLPLGMGFVPVWLANWRFGWFKRSLLAGLIAVALVEGLGLYYRLTTNEVWVYMVLLVPPVMAVWPIFGAYFRPFQPAPAPEAPSSAVPGKPAGKLLLLVFLPVFALLGGLTALTLVQLLRALFAGNLLIRLAWLGFIAACTVFAFRKFRVIWKDPALEPLEGASMLVLAWLTFLTGAAIAQINYRSPAAVMEDKLISDQNACDEHAKRNLSVYGVSESHAPGTGHILVKATFSARTPLVISGGDWTPNDPASGVHFFSEVDRTELKPGEPRELSIRVVLNPAVETLPALGVDGPYFISEIRGYVYDPAVTEAWNSRFGESTCRTALVRNLTTGAYKAADFTREEWSGNKDRKAKPVPVPVTAAPGKPAQTKEESDQMIKDAKALLREAERELEDARETEKKVNRLITQ